jgi:hypothetical protein
MTSDMGAFLVDRHRLRRAIWERAFQRLFVLLKTVGRVR